MLFTEEISGDADNEEHEIWTLCTRTHKLGVMVVGFS